MNRNVYIRKVLDDQRPDNDTDSNIEFLYACLIFVVKYSIVSFALTVLSRPETYAVLDIYMYLYIKDIF